MRSFKSVRRKLCRLCITAVPKMRGAAEQAITSLSFSLCPESATSQFSPVCFFPPSFFVYLSASLFILFRGRRLKAIHSHFYGLLSVFEIYAVFCSLTCSTASPSIVVAEDLLAAWIIWLVNFVLALYLIVKHNTFHICERHLF